MDEWILRKYVVYTHNGLLFSHAKGGCSAICKTGMDFEHIMLNEISQRKILYGLTYTWNLKKSNIKKEPLPGVGG